MKFQVKFLEQKKCKEGSWNVDSGKQKANYQSGYVMETRKHVYCTFVNRVCNEKRYFTIYIIYNYITACKCIFSFYDTPHASSWNWSQELFLQVQDEEIKTQCFEKKAVLNHHEISTNFWTRELLKGSVREIFNCRHPKLLPYA